LRRKMPRLGGARDAVYAARVPLDTSIVRVRVAPGPLSEVTTASRALVLTLNVKYIAALSGQGMAENIFPQGRQ
jgi:hypothetical protein